MRLILIPCSHPLVYITYHIFMYITYHSFEENFYDKRKRRPMLLLYSPQKNFAKTFDKHFTKSVPQYRYIIPAITHNFFNKMEYIIRVICLFIPK